MKRPEEVKLNREQGDELINRLEQDQLSADDRHVLAKLVQLYFWLTFALSETKISLHRLKLALFGTGAKTARTSANDDGGGDSSGGEVDSAPASPSEDTPPSDEVASDEGASDEAPHDEADTTCRRGHGRQSAAAYSGAELVHCHHETLAVGQRCPVCVRRVAA